MYVETWQSVSRPLYTTALHVAGSPALHVVELSFEAIVTVVADGVVTLAIVELDPSVEVSILPSVLRIDVASDSARALLIMVGSCRRRALMNQFET